MIHRATMCCFATFALCSATDRAIAADTVIDPEKLLEVVRAHERTFETRVRSARWSGSHVRGELFDRQDLARFRLVRDPIESAKWTITFEPPTGRYRMDIQQVTRWHKGLEDYAGVVRSYSSDGKTRRRLQTSRGGTELPSSSSPGTGRIEHPDMDHFLRSEGGGTGLGNFPPHFMNRRFSTFLEERIVTKERFYTVQQADGIWRIETNGDPGFAAGESEDAYIVYDPIRGLPLAQEIYGKLSLNGEWAGKLLRTRRIIWKEKEKGLWLPEHSDVINVFDRRISRTSYHDIRINETIDESQFALQFPIGTLVVDEVEKKMYTVSGGVVDEQSAIRAFIQHEKLNAPRKPSFWRTWRIYLISAAVLLGLALAGGGAWFWRRRHAAIAALLLVLFACTAASGAEPDKDGGWRVSHGKGESFAISQCGLNVTLFTLEFFDVKYQLKAVSVGLPPTEEGIRFADIKAMLEAHGLEVIARDRVSYRDRKKCGPGTHRGSPGPSAAALRRTSGSRRVTHKKAESQCPARFQ